VNPPENDVLNFIKDFLWAPLLALIGWAWHRNEQEHKALRDAHDKLKDQASQSHSVLNDKFMEHIDARVADSINFAKEKDMLVREEMAIQRGHIAKLYDKIEEHARRSEDRHHELLSAIHSRSVK
jgi:hypothetical protein